MAWSSTHSIATDSHRLDPLDGGGGGKERARYLPTEDERLGWPNANSNCRKAARKATLARTISRRIVVSAAGNARTPASPHVNNAPSFID